MLLDYHPELRLWHGGFYESVYSAGSDGFIDMVLVQVKDDRFESRIFDEWSEVLKAEGNTHIAAFEMKYANSYFEEDFEKLLRMQESTGALPVFVYIDSDGSPKKPSENLSKWIPEYAKNRVVVLYGYPYHPDDWMVLLPKD